MIPTLVVPTLTRHDLLARMLVSVDVPVNRLVIIDNSGTLDVAGLGFSGDLVVLPMPVNLGVAASWNLACRLAYRDPWVMIASDDVTFPPGALEEWAVLSGGDKVVLSETWPHWCAFSLGMGIVSRVGLFDEGYYPAYFEDTDYERRLTRAEIVPIYGPAVEHRNSSTLRGGDFARANDRSYAANQTLFSENRLHGFDPLRWRDQAWL